MDASLVFEIVKWLVIILLGLLACYFRAREDVTARVEQAIANAEETYKDATKAGGQKFDYAVNWLYEKLPSVLKLVISKSTIGVIVQNAFDVMESYVYTRLDEFIDKQINIVLDESDKSEA